MESFHLEPLYAIDIKIHDLFVENRLSLLSLLKIKIKGFDSIYIKLPSRNITSPHIYTIVLESENYNNKNLINEYNFSTYNNKTFSYIRHNVKKLTNLLDNNNILCGIFSLITLTNNNIIEDNIEDINEISVKIYYDKDDLNLICYGELKEEYNLLTKIDNEENENENDDDNIEKKSKKESRRKIKKVNEEVGNEEEEENLQNFTTNYADYLELIYKTSSPLFIPLFFPPSSIYNDEDNNDNIEEDINKIEKISKKNLNKKNNRYQDKDEIDNDDEDEENIPNYAGELPISISLYKLNDNKLLKKFLLKENFINNNNKEEIVEEVVEEIKNEEVKDYDKEISIQLPNFPKYNKNIRDKIEENDEEDDEDDDEDEENEFNGEWLIDTEDEDEEEIKALDDDSVDEFVSNFNQKGIDILKNKNKFPNPSTSSSINQEIIEKSFIDDEYFIDNLDSSYYNNISNEDIQQEKNKKLKKKKKIIKKKHSYGSFVFPPPKPDNIVRWKI